jgi:hypothetical protein
LVPNARECDSATTDIAELQARLAAALAERDAAIAARDEALSWNDRLLHLLHQLQRMQFGRRSEKLDPGQFALAFEDVEQAIAAGEAADDKQNEADARARADQRRANRGALPAHLPRVHVTPLYRQAQMLAAQGLDIKRSVLRSGST